MPTEIIKLPGLVDIHVHFRDPGQTHKEDFLTGTSAALAGGFTTVFDMPNNVAAVTTQAILEEKITSARGQVVCDIGFHFGSLGDNLGEFAKVQDKVCGLKLYLNVTTGNYKIDADYLTKIFTAWNSPKPILLHAEADVITEALKVTAVTGQRTHVCHISNRGELEPILAAKRAGLPVTCGVTPHHLFLTEHDEKRLGNYGLMKPSLKPQADVDYLWEHFADIDIIESDHAPHTHAEKAEGTFGVPGLETTLPLLLQAEREGKLARGDIVAKCHTKPLEILSLPAQPDTYVEVEPLRFEFSNDGLKTKAGWTPFAGMSGFGKVQTVVLRGEKVYQDGQITAKPGSGKILP